MLTPPGDLLAPCVSEIISDGSVGTEIMRLADLAQCGRDRVETLRQWYDDHLTAEIVS